MNGKVVKITQEAFDYIEQIRHTELGAIPIGECASTIILEHKKRSKKP